ncbi:MAG: hypothetical protein KH828_07890 [Clostridiales bacterium]|nr:hypothetical protein [Clostridiales bacterium]
MSVISSIRDFIFGCPYLNEFEETFSKLDLDKLEEDATSYMVESVPAEPIVKRYTNGDTRRRVAFAFCSRVFYGDVENIDTSDFYEKFSDWLEECTRNRRFPKLDESKEAIKIRATTNGYLMDAETHTAQYRIQCEFIYYQKRRQ